MVLMSFLSTIHNTKVADECVQQIGCAVLSYYTYVPILVLCPATDCRDE